jgi:pimeloyl-ACP methyl ester carboxylesterase
VAEKLAADGVRCILPDWPLGAHRRPVNPDADLSPVAVAAALAGLLAALDLHDVVLVGSDTGGGLCQLALRGDTHRVSGLVLTNCDAFEQFPPRFFVPLVILARSRFAVWTLAQQTRLRVVRHSPLGFGPLLNRPRPAGLTRGWIQPLLDSAAIRRDVTRFARGMQRTELADAATWLSQFEGPVHLVWGTRDKHFTIELGRRLAAAFRRAQLDEVAEATTFVSIDRPDAVVSAVRDVLGKSRGPNRPAPPNTDNTGVLRS